MASYEENYKKSIEVLTKYIKETKIIPTEKEWNTIAIRDNYLTTPTIGYISGIKFPELCKKIYKEVRKGETKKWTYGMT